MNRFPTITMGPSHRGVVSCQRKELVPGWLFLSIVFHFFGPKEILTSSCPLLKELENTTFWIPILVSHDENIDQEDKAMDHTFVVSFTTAPRRLLRKGRSNDYSIESNQSTTPKSSLLFRAPKKSTRGASGRSDTEKRRRSDISYIRREICVFLLRHNIRVIVLVQD
jgi:hypothetical protein